MTPRRRRALASAIGALVVAVLCAVLSSNVDGGQRTVLLLLTVAWLVIAGTCVMNALKTAPPAGQTDVPEGDLPAAPMELSEAPTELADEPTISTEVADDQA